MEDLTNPPVQSPQSWPLVHHRLFLGHWIECRLALSWGGRKCRPSPVCDLRRWSWSPRRRTSTSTANHRSLLHNVSGAGAEIGSYWFIKTHTHTQNTQTNSLSTVNCHTSVANNTAAISQIHKKPVLYRLTTEDYRAFLSTTEQGIWF